MRALSILIVFLSFNSVFAQSTDLKDIMKSMGAQFKELVQSVKAGEVKSADVVVVETLQSLASDASLIYPITAGTVAQKLRYSELSAMLMNKPLKLEEKVEEALSSNPSDLSEVKPLFFEINDIRKESHDEFKLD